MPFEPKGIIPAMVTPFDSKDRLNEAVLRKLTNYLIDGGVHGLFAIGSQGEFYALTREEKKRITEIVVEEVNGRIPVYIGTGAMTTREAVLLTQMAERAGAGAVSVITPCFISPSEDELFEHYVTIAKSTKLPVLLYSNPGRTGINMSVKLVAKLSRLDNIVGIKDSSGDLTLTMEYIRNTDADFSVLAGRDTLIYGTLLHDGKGAIAATANVVPRLVVEIYEAFVKGDLERAKKAQFRLAPLRIGFGLGSFPVVIKDALKLIGIDAGSARKPIKSLSGSQKGTLKKILEDLGLPNVGVK